MSVPEVSVIVPVFNAEYVLGECLDSLLAQTMADIEIIVIDDGSTDGSAAICARYAASDSRIKVISQDNRGVSSARNVGLDIATGKYLAFADADDVFPKWGIERLLGYAAHLKVDLVIGGYSLEQGDTSRAVHPFACATLNDLLCSFLTGRNHSAFWNKLVRRSVLGEARFPAGIRYAEDQVLLISMLTSMTLRFAIVREPIYCHRLSAVSATGSGGRSLLDLLAAKLIIANILLEKGLNKRSRACFMEGSEKAVVSVIRNINASLSSEAQDHLLIYANSMRSMGFPIRRLSRANLTLTLARLPPWAWKRALGTMQKVGERRKTAWR